MFKVTVVEFYDGQTVDILDMQALIQAVNKKPRAPRSDVGRARKKAE